MRQSGWTTERPSSLSLPRDGRATNTRGTRIVRYCQSTARHEFPGLEPESPLTSEELQSLARNLQTLARGVLGNRLDARGSAAAEQARAFRDELGHSRAVDEPLILHVLGWAFSGDARAVRTRSADASPDIRRWWDLVERQGGGPAALPAAWPTLAETPTSPGPIVPRPGIAGAEPGDAGAIEVWTETELRALHAQWWLAQRSTHALVQQGLIDGVRSAAAWHIEHTQPDNATGYPWAAHVFLIEAAIRTSRREPGASEAAMFGQTLIHNALVNPASRAPGTPDLLSAWILADVAAALWAWLAKPLGRSSVP